MVVEWWCLLYGGLSGCFILAFGTYVYERGGKINTQLFTVRGIKDKFCLTLLVFGFPVFTSLLKKKS